MPTPDLSVIICTYNRGPSLLAVLENLQEQRIQPPGLAWEVILVDNNSTDDTRRRVEEHRARFTYPIHYVFEPRQGKSFALNRGLETSRAAWLAFTDDDVILAPNWLDAVQTAFRVQPYKAFGGKVLPRIEGALPPWLATRGPYRVMGGPLVSHDRGDRPRPYDRTMFVPAGCNMFVRRELFDRFGGFRTDLGHYASNDLIYGEDTEIMFRFQDHGETLYYVPEALVHHPAPAERMRKSYFRRYYWGAGRGGARRMAVPAGVVRYANIPRHLIRATLVQGLKLLAALPSGNACRIFQRELLLVYNLGMALDYYIQAD
jgi:glycosyltransferase involved in cell wall biosynthesis